MEIFRNFQSAELEGQQIRVMPGFPKKVSVLDVIKVVTGHSAYRKTWLDISQRFPEVVSEINNFKFPGQGQRETPVVGAKGLVTIMNLLQGERAARFRAAEADVLVRYLGGDLTLIGEVQGISEAQRQLPADHPARIFGEHVEATAGYGDPRTMLATAEKLVAIRPELKETSGLLREFPFQQYGTYLEMRGREMEMKERECALDERQLVTKRKRFELTQEEDQHAATANLAKQSRYEATTRDGVTITAILAELSKSVRNSQHFIKKAEELGVRLRAYNSFPEALVPGSRAPRRYRNDAAQDIGEAIKRWVADAQPGATDGIRKYFTAQQAAAPQTPADPDLYD